MAVSRAPGSGRSSSDKLTLTARHPVSELLIMWLPLGTILVRTYAVGGHAGASEYCVIFSAPATRNHRSLTDSSNNC
jgi:hypothetical protein